MRYIFAALLACLIAFTACQKETEEVEFVVSNVVGMAPDTLLGYQQSYLSENLYVILTTAEGVPVAGEPVRFTLASGNAEITNPEALSNQNGTAYTTVYLTTPGVVVIKPEIEGVTHNVAYIIKVGEAYASRIEKVAGDSSALVSGSQETIPFTVKITDDFGNPSEGAGVQFSLVSGSGTFQGSTLVEADEQGLATIHFTPGSDHASHVIEAAVSESLSVSFNAYTLFPTTVVSDTTMREGHYISWEKSINPFFETYKIYRATTDFLFASTDYELLAEISDVETLSFIDTTTQTGGYYAYRVDIETRPEEIVQGVEREGRHSFHIDYAHLDRGLSQTRQQVYYVLNNNQAVVYDLNTLSLVNTFDMAFDTRSMALSYDEQKLYAGNNIGQVLIYNAISGEPMDTLDIAADLLSSSVDKLYHAGQDKLIAYNSSYRRYILVDITGAGASRKVLLDEMATLEGMESRMDEYLFGSSLVVMERGQVYTPDFTLLGTIATGSKALSVAEDIIYNADLYGLTIYDATTLEEIDRFDWSIGTPYYVQLFDNDQKIMIQTTDYSDNYQNPKKTFVIDNPWVE